MFKRKARAAIANSDGASESMVFPVLKGAIFAVFVSLILVLIFAFIIKFTNMSDGLIRPINQIIKIASILAGVFYCIRKSAGRGLLKGIIIGLTYIVLSFIVFSILDGSFHMGLNIFNDLLFGLIVGAACGVIVSMVSK